MRKRTSALLSLGFMLAAIPAQAQTYPSKSVTIVVTAAAGGVSDVVARAIGQRLSEAWGQQVVIENRGGGAHIIGGQAVAKAPPDGHTLLVAEGGFYVVNPALYPKEKLSVDIEKDLEPITGLVRVGQAVVASNALPASNMRELLDLAARKPGELTFGTSGVGSAPHMNIVRLQSLAHRKLQPIHYRGAAPALNDIIAGHIDLMSVSVSLVEQPAAEKRLKLLGVGTTKRSPRLPEVPTVSEAVPGYEGSTWFGLATTGGTPRDVVMKINADVQKILSDPAFQEKFMAPQQFESMASSPEEFALYLKAETEKWANVIREQKLVIE